MTRSLHWPSFWFLFFSCLMIHLMCVLLRVLPQAWTTSTGSSTDKRKLEETDRVFTYLSTSASETFPATQVVNK